MSERPTPSTETRALWEIRAVARVATDPLGTAHLTPSGALAVIRGLVDEAQGREDPRPAVVRAIEALDALQTDARFETTTWPPAFGDLKDALIEAREASS